MTAVRPLLDAILNMFPISPTSPPNSVRSTSSLIDAPLWNYPYPSHASRFLSKQTPSIAAPTPQAVPKAKGSIDSKSSNENLNGMLSPGGGRGRMSHSPSRHHGLTALSPLQAFSPLQQTAPLPKTHSRSNSDVSSTGGQHSRRNSVVRSLSRRQSLIANAEKWQSGDDDYDYGDAIGLFSRLTLVKAPEQGANLKRAKSSSALAPFSASLAAMNTPATSPRGPRRSFAASSFASFTPPASDPASLKSLPSPFTPHSPDISNRLTHLHNRYDDDSYGPQRKVYSPEQVVELSASLDSPIAMPVGGFKGAELKRRKSADAANRRGSGVSPDKPPVALEPVEYVQMDDDTLLPYVDRPTEVKELVAHPSNESLFKLLKAAFPKHPLRLHWKALSPEEWYWDEFVDHLTNLSRLECPDYAWVFRARQAVRARSVALWEKLGICLGCDGDLLNAGGEDGSPPSWGGLSLGEEGEYDPTQNHVFVEGIEAADAEETQRAERQLREAFGDIVEDEEEAASAGMTALLGTIGEGEEGMSHTKKTAPVDIRKSRSKSFVGLNIVCSPTMANGEFARSPSFTPGSHNAPLPMFDRGPGSPLFPSSFSSLSVEPNLGRSASVGIGGGIKAAPADFGTGGRRWSKVMRKQSGTGLSESAITFASESEYGSYHGEPVNV